MPENRNETSLNYNKDDKVIVEYPDSMITITIWIIPDRAHKLQSSENI